MSMNENLEVRVSELTDVIKNLSDKPMYNSVDVNNLLNSLVQKVENANEEGFYKLTNDVSESVLDVLERKNEDIKDRLSVFENFITSVEKTVQNPKVETEITRILNDIEALHSKMNSQELQTEGLIKSFESMKNVSASGQITKLCDEIVSISKSYDGIVEVLNENFQEFLRRIEALSSREEFQRLRYLIESVEGNQNVLVSAMNALSDKQEEIKNLIKQSSSSQNSEKMEQLQNMLNQLNVSIIETTSKADLEVIADKISSVVSFLSELKRSMDENNNSDVRNVFQGQLNNIIGKLEGLNLDNGSSLSEDIIRLYTSIAEFKDGAYSAIDAKLNDVVASMDVQFDKISNSMVNAALDSSENVSNLTGEVQKMNSVVVDGLNSNAAEIKREIQDIGQQNVITVVNSIKGELSSLLNELSSLNNNESLSQLAKSIEGLRNGIDIDSLILQMDQIRSALDLDPIKEQLMILNKNEALSEINNKIDLVLESFRADEVLSKIDDLGKEVNLDRVYGALDSINQKLDFDSLEEKILKLQEFLSNVNFEENVSQINDKLETIESIKEELVSVKNIDSMLSEIKNQLEENFKLYSQKMNEEVEADSEIKDALRTIYQIVSEEKENPAKELSNEIKENLQNATSAIQNEIAGVQDSFKNISSGNLDEIKSGLSNLKDTIYGEINSLKNQISDLPSQNGNEGIGSAFEELALKFDEKISSLQNLIKETNSMDAENIKSEIRTGLEEIQREIKGSISNFVEQTNSSQTDVINSFVKSAVEESNLDINTRINEEIEKLANSLISNDEASKEELINKIKEIADGIENSPKNEENINSIKDGINRVIENNGLLKDNIESNKEILGEIKDNLSSIYSRLSSSILNSDFDAEGVLNKIGETIDELNTKTTELGSKENLLNSEFALNTVNESIKSIQTGIEEILKENLTKTQEKLAALNSVSATGQAKIAEVVIQNNSEVKSSMSEMLESIESNNLKVNDTLAENSANIESALNSIGEKVNSINTKITETTTQNKASILETIDDLNLSLDSLHEKVEELTQKGDLNAENLSELIKQFEGTIINEKMDEIKQAVASSMITILNDKIKQFEDTTVNDKMNEIKQSVASSMITILNEKNKLGDEKLDGISNSLTSNFNEVAQKTDEIKRNLTISIDKVTEQLKEEVEDIKSKLAFSVDENNSEQEGFTSFLADIEEKIQEKISSIEVLIEDASLKLDSKTSEILNTNDENYKNRLEDVVSTLKSNFEDKMTDVQKIVDEKVYTIINQNNEIIKDELKLRADAILRDLSKELKDKISRVENLSKLKDDVQEDADAHSYTMADVESDMAKIRLGLEKSNKLSNFKEFAARLVELKNINLENAKISRVIGADIMRFDSWLKNATAKIDVLAAKIEKSEKIKMEDLKTRLMQSEKNQAMPQKLEEAVMTIYKKYRAQENKIEEMINKLDSLNQKQTDTFEIKEFIDLFYDNTKKQEVLVNRMNDIEDKMDLIQAKIDHIISSCIDE